MTNYEDIINLIPCNRPISRYELRSLAAASDRKVRKAIQEAREHGELIVNLQDGSGYQRIGEDDLVQIRRQYKLNEARMKSLSKQQKYLRKILKNAETASRSTD